MSHASAASPAVTIDPSEPPAGETPAPGSGGTMDYPPPAAPAPAQTMEGTANASETSGADFSVSAEPGSGDATTHWLPSSAATNKSAAAPPQVAGYEILGELGRGGMGVVYRARQAKLDRVVALKMVLAGAHAGPDQLARFYTEAQAVAHLQHPNIVQIYEVGEQANLPYFSLEFVDGTSLAQKCGGKPQPVDEAAAMMQTLARAMQHAHEHGVVHRDLKPGNILLTSDGVPKITDFGLAKRLEEGSSSQTKSGAILGTPSYMAPEQAMGDVYQIGPLTDVYALGAMFYELLTGRPPFLAATPMDTVLQVTRDEPVPPGRLQPKLPRDVETICLKCLQKEQRKRYGSAAELADDLHRFLVGEPIRARPVSAPERLVRWCRRNPRVAALSAAVAVLVVAVGVALSVVAVRGARERETVARARDLAGQRVDEASDAIRGGNYRRAQELLRWSDPLLESKAALADVRTELHNLHDQVALYAEFKKLLDSARYNGLFGGRETLQQGQSYCRELIQLYDEIEQRSGRARCGLPPLSPEQEQLFREDVYEAFLVAATVEWNLNAGADDEIRREAAKQAIRWLDRAEPLVPGTRTLRSRRGGFLEQLGDREAAELEGQRARAIQPTSAVDHFWHGFADQLRGDAAQSQANRSDAVDHYRKAIAQYAALLRVRPEHFWAYFNWAGCHFQLGNSYDSIVGYTACIHIKPDVGWPYNNRGTCHLQLKEYDQAIEDYNAAVRYDGDYREAYFNRGLAYLAQGHRDRAIEEFNLAAERNYPAASVQLGDLYRDSKEFDRAIEAYDRALELKPDYALAFTNRALAWLAQGNADQAMEDFGRACAADPNYVPAYLYRADQYRWLKRHDDAVADLSRAITVDPANALAYLRRADAYRDLKRPDDAFADYSKAIELAPEDPAAFQARAMIHLARGNHAAARDDFSAVIRLNPNEAGARRIRAILGLVYLKDFDESLADWTELARLQPTNAEPHYYAGVIRMGLRQYDRALESLEQAAKLKPDFVEVFWARAQIQLMLGRGEQAIAEVNAVIERLAPNKFESYNVRGEIYRKMGRTDDAASDFRRSIELQNKQTEGYTGLALVCERQGKADEAKEHYDRMVAADPSAKAAIRRAEFRRSRRLFDESLTDCDEAARRDPKSALPALVRASIHAARGDHARAVDEAERLLQSAPAGDGQVLYAASCVWSLASQAAAGGSGDDSLAAAYADRAVELLDQATAKGFHELNYPEHNRIADDPALAAIRKSPKFLGLYAPRP